MAAPIFTSLRIVGILSNCCILRIPRQQGYSVVAF